MNKEGKIFTFLLVILLLIAISLVGYIYVLFQKEHQSKIILQDNLNEAKTKLALIEKNIQEYKQKVASLEEQIKTNEEKIRMLNEELEKERLNKKEIEEKYMRLSEEISVMAKENEELQKRYELTKNELESLQGQLKKIEEEKNNLEAKLREIKANQSQVNLGTVVVEQNRSSKKDIKDIRGRVLVINKEYDFAVINLGSQDGVNVGNKFSVYRDNVYLGDIEIERVHNSMSAAKFLSPRLKEKIKEQDEVIFKE